ncbi:hypothetical protein CDL15_Pgr006684 [Punica granatum]|uniref:Peptidase A1 domain-containing protein n=1 Tax=Punica granatum TaxID=22663 RepID=A0A218X6T3_PUNGR|nr:hypothetical protein CDL15_Pgr006684 [Punica granatum]
MARSSPWSLLAPLLVSFSLIGPASPTDLLTSSTDRPRTLILPLSLTPRHSSPSDRDHHRRRLLHGSEPRGKPNARMRLYDDLLSNGYYTTRLYIGTPPQEFALIVDTGSTVMYVPCSNCKQCGEHQDPRFQPELSSTYQPVKCNSQCYCDSEGKQCTYERRYAEMSSSSGVLSNDIISFGNESALLPQRALFGCENMETGDLYKQRADGIMGLGRGSLSIVNQLVQKGVISDSFSLCYGGMGVGGGAMILGAIPPPADMVFSHSDPHRSPYYNLEMKEIHVAGKPLKLKSSTFNGRHGTVLDSGTTYAYLPATAFVAFKDAIIKNVLSLKQIPGPDPHYHDICFAGAGWKASHLSQAFPEVDMVFKNGRKLSLSPENYLFRKKQEADGPAPSDSIPQSHNTSLVLPPSEAPSGLPSSDFAGQLHVGLITFDMSFSGNDSNENPNFTELAELIARELEIDASQVQLLNFTHKGNKSVIKWAIFPTKSAKYISKSTALSMIMRLRDHHVQLPERFGNYELVQWSIEPQKKQTWWHQHVWVVAASATAAVLLNLSIFGIWFVWRNKQQSVVAYKPVGSVVPEQELQPL